MPLNDLQIRRAKIQDKAYTLSDGLGLSLLVEPNGSKSWRFRYRFSGKPKMISFGVYPSVTLADARQLRDEARRQVSNNINPSEFRKQNKRESKVRTANTFETLAREWHSLKRAKWSAGYASDVMEAFTKDIFPFLGARAIAEIKPIELLDVFRKIESRGALEKMRKVRQRCAEVFRYSIATGRAEYNAAADLSTALIAHQSKNLPYLNAEEISGF